MQTAATPVPRLFSFIGGSTGPWRVESMVAVTGEPLASAEKLAVVSATPALSANATWLLRGMTSNERYVERAEKTTLIGKQEGLGRAQATCAALIPIRKTAAFEALLQALRATAEWQFVDREVDIRLSFAPD